MSASSDNKLLATAIGAAVAGAAMGIAAMKFSDNRQAQKRSMETPSQGRTTIPSYIFEDVEEISTRRMSTDNIIFPHNHEEKMRRQIMARAAVEEDNVQPRNSVTLRVPATSANMGPGCKLSSIVARWIICFFQFTVVSLVFVEPFL